MDESTPPAEPNRGGRPTLTSEERNKADAKRRLWNAGILSWKFQEHPWGKEMYDFIRRRWGQQVHLRVHRRGIKTSTGLLIGIEECLRQTCEVAAVCKSKDMAQGIIDAILPELWADCPKALRPRRIKNDFKYVFDHNGSKITILPTDAQNFVKARGRKFRFIHVIEAGFIDKLDHIDKTVLAPTTSDVLGRWEGTIVLESNTAETPQHDWIQMYAEAELDDRAYFLPLSQNKWASPLFLQKALRESGGADTLYYRREYECEFEFDESETVIPEFTAKRAFEGDPEKKLPPLVRDIPRPGGSDLYSSMDMGGRHLTALLWAYYHFEQDTVVIEDEMTLLNMTSDDLAIKVKLKEKELWGEHPEARILRVADNNNVQMLYDLMRLHRLRYLASAKDNKDAQINQVRLMVRDGRLVIHPRCKLLIKTMRLAKREKTARGLSFVEMDDIGHADLLDALIYLVRNVKRNAMPVQAPVNHVVRDWSPPQEKSQAGVSLLRALGLGRRR